MKQHRVADDLAAEVGGACLGMRVARLHRVVALVRAGTAAGGTTRVTQRLLAMAACIWHNWAISTDDKRSLIAYDH
jgi:hypothetical protein